MSDYNEVDGRKWTMFMATPSKDHRIQMATAAIKRPSTQLIAITITTITRTIIWTEALAEIVITMAEII